MTKFPSKTPGKLMLMMNSVNWGDQETHELQQSILKELETKEIAESCLKRAKTATENSNKVEKAVYLRYQIY